MWASLKGPSAVAARAICFLCFVVIVLTTPGWIDFKFAYLTISMLLYIVPCVFCMNR